MERVVFLDFDGVIRIWKDGKAKFERAQQKRVVALCRATNARIVISSDWRGSDAEDYLCELLPGLVKLLHADSTIGIGPRHEEVERWLGEHPKVENFVILEDVEAFFVDASHALKKRLVLCDSRSGFTKALDHSAREILAK